MVVYVSLFQPRNPLSSNGGIVVKPGCVGAWFGPRNPFTGDGGICGKAYGSLIVLL